jgi:hypothetical protein
MNTAKYFLLSIMSLVVVKSLNIAPAEQQKKFHGAIPIKTDRINFNEETFKCGKVIFITQLGDPGNNRKKIM